MNIKHRRLIMPKNRIYYHRKGQGRGAVLGATLDDFDRFMVDPEITELKWIVG